MLQKYVDLINSFKKHQISKLIEQINQKVFAALKSPKINPLIAPYFQKINEEGPPFTGYERDPDNVSQVKKLANALYYAKRTFVDLESVNLSLDIGYDMLLSAMDIKYLWDKTMNEAYEACYLATHLDVDVQDMFREELALFFPAISKLEGIIKENSEQTKEIAEAIQEYPLSYKVGEVMGVAVEQMQPSTGSLDYDFLTQFSVVLPGYIDKVTQYLKQYSSHILQQEPSLNNAKVEELQKTAFNLLNDLENLKTHDNGLFVSFKAIHYIGIIRKIITLSNTSLEQIGHLSDSSQDVIRENLAQLKYNVFPQLFGLIDKIEANSMLKPGTLSIPLMKKIKPLYQTLIFYASKPVNFKEKGAELLSIEDSRFLAARLEHTYRRIDESNKALFKIGKAEEAAHHFYALLSTAEYQNLALHQLPKNAKEQIIEHYKILKPYMVALNIDLNDTIMAGLQQEGESWFASLTKSLPWFNKQLPADHISIILASKDALQTAITKKKNTHELNIKVNNQLIESVQKETDLALYPYSEETSVFSIEELKNDETEAVGILETQSFFSTDESSLLNTSKGINNLEIKYSKEEKNQYVMNPQNLSAEQALSLYRFYQKKYQHIVNAEKAFVDLIKLLEKHTHYAGIPGVKLNLNDLSAPIRAQCQKLYALAQPYFLEGAPKERKEALLKFDQFVVHSFADKTSPQEPVINMFEQLKEHINDRFKETKEQWKQREQIYYKWAQKQLFREELNVFVVDESKVLRNTKTIKFVEEQGNKVVADKNCLTADQAITLYQLYRNKHDKFMSAKKAYSQFMILLNKYSTPSLAQERQLHLNQLNKRDKILCRKLYNLFQPYFIHGIPKEMKPAVIAFDKLLVNAFTENTTYEDTPPIDFFKSLDEYFQIAFSKIDLAWNKKSRQFFNYAQEKFASENKAATLKKDTELEARAHYLIKSTKYSKIINDFRTSLFQLTTHLSKSMQDHLKPKRSGVPFPEVGNTHQALAQSKQLIGLKQIFNSLYHIEHIMRQLEQLNDKSLKTTYLYHAIMAYDHINDIIKLTEQLAKDSHFGLIGRELVERAQSMWAIIQEHTEAYQVSADEIKDGKVIKYSALWYSLNAFFITPKHIRSLTNNNYLTTEELDKLHRKAKEASVNIESIIANSNSYFRLFLQTPKMLMLYKELPKKLNEFVATSHDAVKNNLDRFHSNIFMPMLLEADLWEDKFGLAPGAISGPIKQIIDEYYKGLLQPLNLPSKLHIQLISDNTVTEKRLSTTQAIIEKEKKLIKKNDERYQSLTSLYEALKVYEYLTGDFFSKLLPEPQKIEEAKSQLIKAYKKALPTVVSLQEKLNFKPSDKLSTKEVQIDALLNEQLKEYNPKLKQIQELIHRGYHYYVGKSNSHYLKLSSAKEKLVYLNNLNKEKAQNNQAFIDEYTSQAFNKHLDSLINRHIGLQYIEKEYKARLQEYLLTFKDEIIRDSKKAEDINVKIKELLTGTIQGFEKRYFAKYYHLDTVKVVLAQFKNYFSVANLAIESQNSLFENEQTLSKKTSYINKLLAITENERLSVDERFKEIKRHVENPNFKRAILAHKQVDHFSFAYLKRLFLSLLEALHLYSPPSKTQFKQLKNAVDNEESQMNKLTQRFGLFSKAKTKPEAPPLASESKQKKQASSTENTEISALSRPK